MTQDDRLALARVVERWRDSKVMTESLLAANLTAILSLQPEDAIYLRQEARRRPIEAADLLCAADIIHRIGPVPV
jgi:hypothetical protein